MKNKDNIVNNNFIWDVEKNEMRESNFLFDEEYNDFILESDSFGKYSVFRSFCFTEGKVVKSPCYYVDNRTERIVATSDWESTDRYKFEYPGYG
mgnify:CR=1 FL=1